MRAVSQIERNLLKVAVKRADLRHVVIRHHPQELRLLLQIARQIVMIVRAIEV
jgi:hypothetical protein